MQKYWACCRISRWSLRTCLFSLFFFFLKSTEFFNLLLFFLLSLLRYNWHTVLFKVYSLMIRLTNIKKRFYNKFNKHSSSHIDTNLETWKKFFSCDENSGFTLQRSYIVDSRVILFIVLDVTILRSTELVQSGYMILF